MKILLLVLLLVPQLAAAKVFMCVDPATGKTSFTDRACEKAAAREEVRVDPTNLDSGGRTARGGSAKTWNSQRDTRKTGNDYNAQRRDVYQNNPTASAD
jgi:hypothetical protein